VITGDNYYHVLNKIHPCQLQSVKDGGIVSEPERSWERVGCDDRCKTAFRLTHLSGVKQVQLLACSLTLHPKSNRTRRSSECTRLYVCYESLIVQHTPCNQSQRQIYMYGYH